MNKRLLFFIIGGLAVLVLLGGVLFYATQRQKEKEIVVAGPQIVKISDEPVISPVAAYDNNSIWYFNTDGRLFSRHPDGSSLSEYSLPALSGGNLKTALWPPTGDDFIVIAGAQNSKSFYSSKSKIYVNLPANIQYLDWLPDGKRIVYIWRSSDNKTQQLAMADADGTGFRMIKDVLYPDLIVKAAPDGKTVLMYRASIPGDVNKIYSANLENGEIVTVVGEGKNITASWIPSTNKFIFSRASTTAYPKIYVYDSAIKQATDLVLNTTLERTVASRDGKYLYAAVSKDDNSGDRFVKIDLSTNKAEIYFEPNQSVRVKNMLMVGNTIYYASLSDNKLYVISK